jgi:hypothetical protein
LRAGDQQEADKDDRDGGDFRNAPTQPLGHEATAVTETISVTDTGVGVVFPRTS